MKESTKSHLLQTLSTLQNKSENSPTPFREKARLDITIKFLKYSIMLITTLIVGSFCYNYLVHKGDYNLETINVGNLISLVIGQLGTSLGLIIGFYFKDK